MTGAGVATVARQEFRLRIRAGRWKALLAAFFVVLLSTVLQGLTIEPVARWLGVTADEAAIPAPLVEPVLLNRLGAETMQFPVRKGDAIEGRPVRELGLPREALLNVIVRGDRAIPPRGSTIIQEDDQLHVLVRQEVAMEFRELMRRWRTSRHALRKKGLHENSITGKVSTHEAQRSSCAMSSVMSPGLAT